MLPTRHGAVCCIFADQIREYAEKRLKWCRVELRVVSCQQVFTVGECLREVDKMDIVKGDFILVGRTNAVGARWGRRCDSRPGRSSRATW